MHSQLGEFIRLHREQTNPKDVGLPDIGRRRTPGLRREELAQLCGVSPTWLTWMEQGRPVSASAKVLSTLADVMRLATAERIYLFRLADKLDPMLAVATGEIVGNTPSNANAIVSAIKTPAYMLSQQWDVVAWNKPAQHLFAGWLDKLESAEPVSPPNLLHFMFLDPVARTLIMDWPDRAHRLVAEFRADCGKHAEQEPLASMIAQLTNDSVEFKQLWHSQHVVGRDGGMRRFMHPINGELQFDQTTCSVANARGIKLVMLLPALSG